MTFDEYFKSTGLSDQHRPSVYVGWYGGYLNGQRRMKDRAGVEAYEAYSRSPDGNVKRAASSAQNNIRMLDIEDAQ